MANNRMWLVSKETGEKFLLAKYYPDSGWQEFDEGDGLNRFFEANDCHTHHGDEYVLQYEIEGEPDKCG